MLCILQLPSPPTTSSSPSSPSSLLFSRILPRWRLYRGRRRRVVGTFNIDKNMTPFKDLQSPQKIDLLGDRHKKAIKSKIFYILWKKIWEIIPHIPRPCLFCKISKFILKKLQYEIIFFSAWVSPRSPSSVPRGWASSPWGPCASSSRETGE